jgi:hypothetical protein
VPPLAPPSARSAAGLSGAASSRPPAPYLRAYFGRRGVPDQSIHVITAELTLTGLVPRLAGSRPAAARSLAAARAQVTAFATQPVTGCPRQRRRGASG